MHEKFQVAEAYLEYLILWVSLLIEEALAFFTREVQNFSLNLVKLYFYALKQLLSWILVLVYAHDLRLMTQQHGRILRQRHVRRPVAFLWPLIWGGGNWLLS